MEYRKFIESTIVKAGKITLKHFGKAKVKYTKSSATDVVTEADLQSERLIKDAIKKKFPEHSILSEENSELNQHSYMWIIDPVDGTRNFSTSVAIYGVMIALAHNNKLIAAAIYLPYFNELFYAEKGNGAYKNGKKIRCSNKKELAHSYGVGSASYKGDKAKIFMNLLRHAKKEQFWVNTFGSMAFMSILADGRRDWFWSKGGGTWDYAPGSLILKEAGCKVTNFKGKEWRIGDDSLVAANPVLHKKLMKILK